MQENTRQLAFSQKTLKTEPQTYHHGLENIQLKMSIAASDRDSDVIPHDLGSNHGQRLTLGRVHLAFKRATKERVHVKRAHGVECQLRLCIMSTDQEKEEI